MLYKHPDIEQRLCDEIKTVFKGKPPTTSVQLKEAVLLHNVLDETLRLYPSVPIDLRRAQGSDILPSGAHIDADVEVAWSAYVMGRSDKVWKDPETFNPDRWLDKSWSRDAFISFHGGPQTCLGRAFAYMEAKVMMVLLLQKYSLSLVPGQTIAPKPSIVMPARFGVKMEVYSR